MADASIDGIYIEFLTQMLSEPGGTSPATHSRVDLDDDTIAAMLFDEDADAAVTLATLNTDKDAADVIGGIVDGPLGTTVPGVSIDAVSTTAISFNHTIITWSAVASGAAIDAIIYYKANGTATLTSPLICSLGAAGVTVGLAVTPNGGDITFDPHADGVFNFTTT